MAVLIGRTPFVAGVGLSLAAARSGALIKRESVYDRTGV